MSALGTRFDWYEITFDGADDGRELALLTAALGGRAVRSKGRNGYAEAHSIERDGENLATVYGRSVRAGEVHISTTSTACDLVVPELRRLWPEHRVSRADSSVDFAAEFDALDASAIAFAERTGISFRIIRDSDGGATRYLGAKSSEVLVRVYKKSEQLRAIHPEAADTVPDGIVRIELQARPGKRDVKAAASLMTSDDLWGLSAWTREFAAQTMGFDAPRVSTHFRRPSEWARAVHFLGTQWGPVVQARAADVGHDVARAEVLEALGL